MGRNDASFSVGLWSRALTTLQSDPLFEESELASFSTMTLDEDGKAAVRRRFRRLSSGHAIVLLTITRLVELVDERSLVLIDEPEVHLHPPIALCVRPSVI